MLETATVLMRAARRLASRLDELEPKLDAGDVAAWSAYEATAVALAAISAQIRPEARGALLTTAQMAARLNITPKTLLRRKASKEIRPAVQRGHLIRWRGDEVAAR
jgi:hypothetical protein